MRQSPRGRCDTAASSGAPTIGASTAIRLPSELTAPSVWPWLRLSAAYEIMLCTEAVTVTPNRLMAMMANIIQPCVAAPHRA
jgi:hypothetical protein